MVTAAVIRIIQASLYVLGGLAMLLLAHLVKGLGNQLTAARPRV